MVFLGATMTARYCIIFFGIGRGGEAAKTFYDNKFDDTCDTMHVCLDQEFVSNKRSGENFNVRRNRVFLSGNILKIDESNINPLLQSVAQNNLFDIYNDELSSISNLLRQLFIIHQVCKRNHREYEKYIFVRDDTEAVFDIEKMYKLKHWPDDEPRILVPIAHWHGGTCDRFFVVNQNGFVLLSHRLEHALRLLSAEPISSEKIFQRFLKEYMYKVSCCSIKVRRIRSGAYVIKDKYYFPIHRPIELFRVIASNIRFKLRR